MTFLEKIKLKIVSFSKIEEKAKELKLKKSIVTTNGCFDLIHRGHLEYLAEAKNYGDFLWVGINSDFSVKKLKGTERPVQNENDRVFILASLEFVDAVSIFEQTTPIEFLSKINPHFHIKGGDYKKEEIIEKDKVEENGGKVIILPYLKNISTTILIKRAKMLKGF